VPSACREEPAARPPALRQLGCRIEQAAVQAEHVPAGLFECILSVVEGDPRSFSARRASSTWAWSGGLPETAPGLRELLARNFEVEPHHVGGGLRAWAERSDSASSETMRLRALASSIFKRLRSASP